MKSKSLSAFVAILAVGGSLLGTTPALAGKYKPPAATACTVNSAGETVCPYADDEAGEYVENFYSGQWGTAGGGGVVIIGDGGVRFWDAHVVYKLDQEAADSGIHDVVLQDKRVADKNAYSVNLSTLATSINRVANLNVTVGDCALKPEANCVSVVDFTAYDKSSSVGGYMSPRGLYDREMAFNGRFMTGKEANKILLHEGATPSAFPTSTVLTV